jgi:RNA polymerase sigma-70 factor (ECF subfamily)
MPDDRELMARVREGEQSALELLFARWEAPLFAFFYRVGCPPSSVEDLTEEVLVSIYRHRQRYDPTRPFPPWLYGIARLVWKDYLRHRRREIARTALLETAERMRAPEPDPSETAQARETTNAVRQAIEHLPDDQKLAFTLRHYQGLSYEDIAEALHVPLGTVKWRIHEAVRRLEAWRAAARREV